MPGKTLSFFFLSLHQVIQLQLTGFQEKGSFSFKSEGRKIGNICLENRIQILEETRRIQDLVRTGVAKSQTWLSDFTFTFHSHALEKEMATHSSVLAWRIPGTAEPGGLPSLGSHRVGHDWSDAAAAAATCARQNSQECTIVFYRNKNFPIVTPISIKDTQSETNLFAKNLWCH